MNKEAKFRMRLLHHHVYNRERSNFILEIRIFENFIVIGANSLTTELIESVWNFENFFKRQWITQNYKPNTFSFSYDEWNDYLGYKFLNWVKKSISFLWIKLNRNIQDLFQGDELEFCICADWNKRFDTFEHTFMGQIEFEMKYRNIYTQKTVEFVKNYLKIGVSYLNKQNLLITTIPYEPQDEGKLAVGLRNVVGEITNANTLKSTLLSEKPSMKNLTLQEKAMFWQELYESGQVELDYQVGGRNILIVDDLYQSGVSMWAYAKYLKSLGAKKIYGVALVKSLRDDDNKRS